jgi:hypothetical protein
VEEEFIAGESSNASAQDGAVVDDISALKARKEELSKKLAEQVECLRLHDVHCIVGVLMMHANVIRLDLQMYLCVDLK